MVQKLLPGVGSRVPGRVLGEDGWAVICLRVNSRQLFKQANGTSSNG